MSDPEMTTFGMYPEPEPEPFELNKILKGAIWDSSEIVAPFKREWVGLTDEEQEIICDKYWDDPQSFIEAIEAKLKEKNYE
jgi:hypothetical protein